MYPVLFHLGPVSIHSYGVALALAFLLVVGLARDATIHSLGGVVPLTEAQLVDWACWTMLGGILGGRLLYVLLNWEVYVAAPQEILAIWHGGLVWYGGFVGGVLATALYLNAHRYAFLRGADQVIPFVALGHAVGRIGCFANGCCYGMPTFAWWGVQFPGHTDPVVPTQLIESASLIALYVILRRLQINLILRRPGALLGVYLIGYGLIRWVVEYWRAEQLIAWEGVTLHQVISLGLFLVGASLLMRAGRSARVVTSDQ